MKTHGWVAVGLATVLVAVSVPASADFHPDCTGTVTAYANTDLSYDESAGELVYEGLVNCPETTVEIEHLELARIESTQETLATTSGQPCETTLTQQSCSVTDEVAVEPAPGQYQVNMTFSTPGFEDVERLQRWFWTGDGQPVPVCVHTGFFPVSAGACPDGLID